MNANIVSTPNTTFLSVAKSLRPKQWIKNGFVLFPLLFWLQDGLTIPVNDEIAGKLGRTAALFVAFCLAASAGYQVNDIVDVEKDRRHPTKCRRPIAAGLISVGQGAALASVLAVASVCLGFFISPIGLISVLVYFALTNFYNLRGKNVAYLDVLLVGSLYGIRVWVGFDAAALYPVSWKLWVVLAALLATFVELGKRHAELRTVGNRANTRTVLSSYSEGKIDVLYLTLSGMILLAYIPASLMVGGLFSFSACLVVAGLVVFRQEIMQLTEDVHPLELFLQSRRLICIVAAFIVLLGLAVALN